MRRTIVFAGGAITFLVLHVVLVATWQTWFDRGDTLAPWFMNSVRAVECTVVLFALVGLGVSASDGNPGVDTRFATAAYLALGALVPMVAVLFTMRGGPGTLFPIALVFGWGIVFVGAAAGASLGWVFRRFLQSDS